MGKCIQARRHADSKAERVTFGDQKLLVPLLAKQRSAGRTLSGYDRGIMGIENLPTP
jgi:hypothetical protein